MVAGEENLFPIEFGPIVPFSGTLNSFTLAVKPKNNKENHVTNFWSAPSLLYNSEDEWAEPGHSSPSGYHGI